MLWLDWVYKNCSQLTASLPLSAADQAHPCECLTGSVYKIQSLIQHFHFANKGDRLCLLVQVYCGCVVHNPAEWHLCLVAVLKSGDVVVGQIWVWGLTLPWLVVTISSEPENPLGALGLRLAESGWWYLTCFSKVSLDLGENMWSESTVYKWLL